MALSIAPTFFSSATPPAAITAPAAAALAAATAPVIRRGIETMKPPLFLPLLTPRCFLLLLNTMLVYHVVENRVILVASLTVEWFCCTVLLIPFLVSFLQVLISLAFFVACWLAFLATFIPVLVAILNTLPNTLAPMENKLLPLCCILLLLLQAIVTKLLFCSSLGLVF